MRFTKMHGAGNDYVYVDLFREKIADAPRLARAISDRHTGVGSDGLILIAPSRKADFRMIMYNSDGSEGRMCGNGIRCIGKYVFERGLTRRRELSIETAGGLVRVTLHPRNRVVSRVTVDMGRPRASSAVHPNIRSAAGFHVSMVPPRSIPMMASSDDSTIEASAPGWIAASGSSSATVESRGS